MSDLHPLILAEMSGQKASARKSQYGGYKSIIVHTSRARERTEVLGTQEKFDIQSGQSFITKAAPRMERDAAIKLAEDTILHRAKHQAIQKWLFNNRTPEGIRRTKEEAMAVLGITE